MAFHALQDVAICLPTSSVSSLVTFLFIYQHLASLAIILTCHHIELIPNSGFSLTVSCHWNALLPPHQAFSEEGMAAHSSIHAWRIPWTKEPGDLHSIEWKRVGHDWATYTNTHTATYIHSHSHAHTHAFSSALFCSQTHMIVPRRDLSRPSELRKPSLPSNTITLPYFILLSTYHHLNGIFK